MTGERYDRMFARLRARGQGGFVPFLTLGDPDLDLSARLLATVVTAGADALELGIPFSDPVADGPVIQSAAVRALAAGTRVADCWRLIRQVRAAAPELPIGLLVYANLVVRRTPARFYHEAAAAGVDSVLIADLPTEEAPFFAATAIAAGVAPVLILPPNADPARTERIATLSRGYTYVTTREGVTGDDHHGHGDLTARLAQLATLGAPPALLGFGIAERAHVRAALRAGAAGAIAGSALVRRIGHHLGHPDQMIRSLADFVSGMKAATLGDGGGIASDAVGAEN